MNYLLTNWALREYQKFWPIISLIIIRDELAEDERIYSGGQVKTNGGCSNHTLQCVKQNWLGFTQPWMSKIKLSSSPFPFHLSAIQVIMVLYRMGECNPFCISLLPPATEILLAACTTRDIDIYLVLVISSSNQLHIFLTPPSPISLRHTTLYVLSVRPDTLANFPGFIQ